MALTQESKFAGSVGAPRWILVSTGAYLTVDLFVLHLWSAGGQIFSIEGPSDSTSGLSVTAMAFVNLYLCMAVLRGFRAGAPMKPAWTLIALAAAAQALSGVLGQFLETGSLLWAGSLGRPIGRSIGQICLAAQVAGGPIRLALLAAAMPMVLRILRRFGFWMRPTAMDWAVCGIVCLFAVCRCAETGLADWNSLAGLALLCILFMEAMLLRQSIHRMGSGLIPKCWAAVMYGIFLTGFADMALWIVPHYSHAWPPAIIGSLTRFPTAAVFTLAPAYQLMAQRRATKPAAGLPEDLAAGVPAMAR
jgi:hypothetical protein